MNHKTYWQTIWARVIRRPLGALGMLVLGLFIIMALYAPFLASSKPLVVVYDGTFYFPLFRYLFSTAFFTKKIDLFFNLLGVFLPLYLLAVWLKPQYKLGIRIALPGLLLTLFLYFGFVEVLNPADSPYLNRQKEALILQLEQEPSDREARAKSVLPSWDIELEYMNQYAKLNLVLKEFNRRSWHEKIVESLDNPKTPPYTLYFQERVREKREKKALKKMLVEGKAAYEHSLQEEERMREDKVKSGPEELKKIKLQEENEAYEELQNRLQFIVDKRAWLDRQESKISFIIMPPLSQHHWEDDVGGEQALNLQLPFTLDTRINRKDLVSALIFGSRISLFVGFLATFLALGIGIPLGLVSGYYGSKLDMLLCRFVEVWEAMPVFFMLLLIVSILQTKSIFVIILVISLFSWMSAFRFVRAETFREREMLYVDASKAVGFPDGFILVRHILPNSILAVLALLPFDIMAAVTREAALAFLGLGEEQSCSWGVLMDEGRAAFPADSRLLWPPAIILTVLLVAIAFLGQALHAALDPKSEE